MTKIVIYFVFTITLTVFNLSLVNRKREIHCNFHGLNTRKSVSDDAILSSQTLFISCRYIRIHFRKLLSTFIPCFCQELFYWASETKLATVDVLQLSQLSPAVACRLKQTSQTTSSKLAREILFFFFFYFRIHHVLLTASSLLLCQEIDRTLRYTIHYIYYSDLKNSLFYSNSTHFYDWYKLVLTHDSEIAECLEWFN